MHRSILAAILACSIALPASAAAGSTDRESQLARAKSLQQAGDFPSAIRIYDSLIGKDAKDAEALYEVAFSYQMSKSWKECISYARRGMTIESPSQVGSFAVLAVCEDAMGNRPEALRTYGAAVQKFPGDYRARYNYAISLAGNGQLPEAMAQLDAAITAEPRYSPPYLTYGKVLDTYRRDALAVCMYLVFAMIEPQTPRTAEAAARIVMLLNRQVAVGVDGKRTVSPGTTPGTSAQETALTVAMANAALTSGVGNQAVAKGDALLATLEKFMKVAGDLADKEQNFYGTRILVHMQRLNRSDRQAEFLRLILTQAGVPAAATK